MSQERFDHLFNLAVSYVLNFFLVALVIISYAAG